MDREDIVKRLDIVFGEGVYGYDLIKDSKTREDVWLTCEKHGKFKKRLERLLNGSGCPYCSGKIRKSYKQFEEEANKVHDGKYSYHQDYVNSHTDVIITCPIHGDFSQTPTNHLNGCGCPKCKGDKLRVMFSSNAEEFIKKTSIVHGDKYIYDRVKYVNNSTPIEIICREHGNFLQTPNNHLQGRGCPICNQSKLEAHIAKLLDDNDMKYEVQWHLPWNKRFSIDFLINGKIGIECQGIQHFEDGHFKNVTLEEIQRRDKYKLDSCKENGIEIIYFSDVECENCITEDSEIIEKIKELCN